MTRLEPGSPCPLGATRTDVVTDQNEVDDLLARMGF